MFHYRLASRAQPDMTTLPSTPAADHLLRFLLPDAGVRGVMIDLSDTWQQIGSDRDYPAAVAALLGQATAAAALFTGHAKVDGRLSVQLRGSGPLRTLFAECTAAGTLRGIAQLAEDEDAQAVSLQSLGRDAVLAITIENPGRRGGDPVRYQGLVSLQADTLAEAFEGYFRQSEQLPTRLLLASDATRARGLMLQKLPGDEGDADGWNRASLLFDTLPADELLQTPPDVVLHRLFHDEHLQHLGSKPMQFSCSCSRERVEGMLQALGEAEAQAALVVDGQAEVRCEFCGQTYRFSAGDMRLLFVEPVALSDAPDRLQ